MKWIFRLCFVVLFIPVIALCVYLPIICAFAGSVGLIMFWTALLIAEITALALYLKWPWVAAVVGWIDLIAIATGLVPWKGQSARSFMHEFRYDIIFFITAHVGFLSWRASRVRTFKSA